MYGLIGRFTTKPEDRDAFVALLTAGTSGMPGCLSYVVATDPADAGAVWVTEVWDTQASHQASLGIPAVREAITQARPLITGMQRIAETAPVGGIGLPG